VSTKWGDLAYAEFDWYIGQDPVGSTDTQMVNDAVNEYIKPLLNAKVNIHWWPSPDWESKMPAMVASGQDLGIIGFGTQSKLDYVIQSQHGSYYPLDDLLAKYGTGVKGLFKEAIWDAMRIDGKIYGIPSLKDNCYIISLIYNDDMAQRLGLDMSAVPYNGQFYKLENWLTEVLAKREAVYGKVEEPLMRSTSVEMPYNFAVDNFLTDNFLAVTNLEGVMHIKGYEPTKVFNLYGTDEYREFCKAQFRMVQKNIQAYDYTGKRDWYYTGNMFGFPGWGYTYMEEHLYGDAFTTKMVDPVMTWTNTQNYYSTGTAISSASKNPDRAMMFLELVNTDPKLATMMRFGIEGVHYTYDAAGKMQFTEKNAGGSKNGFYFWYAAPVGNLTIVNAPESLTGPDGVMLTRMVRYNREAIVPPLFGFSFDTTPVTNEIAACSSVVMEYRDTLRSGQAASEAEVDRLIDEFNAKLKANGIEKILAEAQKQADAFRAKR